MAAAGQRQIGELGEIQVAIDLGPRVDTAAMPMERRVRHALEVSRAYSSWNRQEEALATLLHAEQMAPEQGSASLPGATVGAHMDPTAAHEAIGCARRAGTSASGARLIHEL
ncbi:hypothetical protein [Couchioplanes caeruleus]|uniref:hypothetical protein n=1 Tax=Couchioplanes caeruleus TaxID=56438 RepID=UPI001FD39E9E|nr:hypothetical protein [Couchioplanes caeruleus]